MVQVSQRKKSSDQGTLGKEVGCRDATEILIRLSKPAFAHASHMPALSL